MQNIHDIFNYEDNYYAVNNSTWWTWKNHIHS